MKIYDQHVHSYYSFDSSQKIEEYLDIVSKLNVSSFVVTDHLDFDFLSKGKDLSFDIEKEQLELDSLQKKYPSIKILKGIELGFKSEYVDRMNEVISSYPFDLVNMSIHDYKDIDFYYYDFYSKYGPIDTVRYYFEAVELALNRFDNFDVMCHIDYGFKTAYMHDPSLKLAMFEDYLIRIMKLVISKDKTLEVNTKVEEYIGEENTRYLLRLYKSLGGKYLTLSSDSHRLDRFYKNFDYYINLIKEEGFDSLSYFVKRQRYQISLD